MARHVAATISTNSHLQMKIGEPRRPSENEHPRTRPESTTRITRLFVSSYTKTAGSHVVYNIEAYFSSDTQRLVRRRYREFLALHESLKKRLPPKAMSRFDFPAKTMGSVMEKTLALRRKKFDDYLIKVLKMCASFENDEQGLSDLLEDWLAKGSMDEGSMACTVLARFPSSEEVASAWPSLPPLALLTETQRMPLLTAPPAVARGGKPPQNTPPTAAPLPTVSSEPPEGWVLVQVFASGVAPSDAVFCLGRAPFVALGSGETAPPLSPPPATTPAAAAEGGGGGGGGASAGGVPNGVTASAAAVYAAAAAAAADGAASSSGTVPPLVPCRDFCGLVVKGSIDMLGKVVLGTGLRRAGWWGEQDGTLRQFFLAKEDCVVEKPKGLSVAQAACLGVPLTSAFVALFGRAHDPSSFGGSADADAGAGAGGCGSSSSRSSSLWRRRGSRNNNSSGGSSSSSSSNSRNQSFAVGSSVEDLSTGLDRSDSLHSSGSGGGGNSLGSRGSMLFGNRGTGASSLSKSAATSSFPASPSESAPFPLGGGGGGGGGCNSSAGGASSPPSSSPSSPLSSPLNAGPPALSLSPGDVVVVVLFAHGNGGSTSVGRATVELARQHGCATVALLLAPEFASSLTRVARDSTQSSESTGGLLCLSAASRSTPAATSASTAAAASSTSEPTTLSPLSSLENVVSSGQGGSLGVKKESIAVAPGNVNSEGGGSNDIVDGVGDLANVKAANKNGRHEEEEEEEETGARKEKEDGCMFGMETTTPPSLASDDLPASDVVAVAKQADHNMNGSSLSSRRSSSSSSSSFSLFSETLKASDRSESSLGSSIGGGGGGGGCSSSSSGGSRRGSLRLRSLHTVLLGTPSLTTPPVPTPSADHNLAVPPPTDESSPLSACCPLSAQGWADQIEAAVAAAGEEAATSADSPTGHGGGGRGVKGSSSSSSSGGVEFGAATVIVDCAGVGPVLELLVKRCAAAKARVRLCDPLLSLASPSSSPPPALTVGTVVSAHSQQAPPPHENQTTLPPQSPPPPQINHSSGAGVAGLDLGVLLSKQLDVTTTSSLQVDALHGAAILRFVFSRGAFARPPPPPPMMAAKNQEAQGADYGSVGSPLGTLLSPASAQLHYGNRHSSGNIAGSGGGGTSSSSSSNNKCNNKCNVIGSSGVPGVLSAPFLNESLHAFGLECSADAFALVCVGEAECAVICPSGIELLNA